MMPESGSYSQLFDPGRHEPLASFGRQADWNPDRAIAWLMHWAQAALAAWQPGLGWPLHPRDASDFDAPPARSVTLYSGEAGVWLALARLAEAGYCSLPRSLAAIFAELDAAYSAAPDTGERVPSWFLGESSLLTLRYLQDPDAALADRLEALIRANRENPTREALWGAPGTMLAALFLHEASNDARWQEVYRDSAAAIWASWQLDEVHFASPVWLWEQDMYQRQTRYIGAGHGWAGNLYPLWRGAALLTPAERQTLSERCFAALAAMARHEAGLVNWPALAENPDRRLVQWCHGAPGIITSLRHAGDVPETALSLLLRGGELILAAGPLRKGPGLCHGTDGNGMALLELFARSGELKWLEAARGFAMAAIVQSEREFLQHRQWRYSLWTGDAGLACYLLDCLDGMPRGLPGLDAF